MVSLNSDTNSGFPARPTTENRESKSPTQSKSRPSTSHRCHENSERRLKRRDRILRLRRSLEEISTLCNEAESLLLSKPTMQNKVVAENQRDDDPEPGVRNDLSHQQSSPP